MKSLRLFFCSWLATAMAVFVTAEETLQTVDVFPAGMQNVALYRIPGLVCTQKGTLLAYSEARLNGRSDWGKLRYISVEVRMAG